MLSALCVASCASTIRTPRAPEEPVATFLLVDAMHRGLWFPREGGGYVEYGYGDWSWYAEGDDRWHDVFRTVFWPTRGTLGRRLSSARDEEDLRRRNAGQSLHRLEVDREAMRALRDELDAAFAAHQDEQVHNSRHGMSFVPAPDSYWAGHNCNDAVARWLERLGCSVSCALIRIGLDVRDSD